MGERINLSSGVLWEEALGYSRAVKLGNIIEISGTTAVDEENNIVGENNPYEQATFIFNKIKKVLENLGSSITDVVRTRMFIVDMGDWEDIGRAHGEFFKDIKPASTMVEVKGLINPKLLMEIEATAIINSPK